MARFGIFRLDVSDAILDEMVGVLRDKFKTDGYSLQDRPEKIRSIANHVMLKRTLDGGQRRSRRQSDPRMRGEAGSDCIITEDKHLLRLGSFEGVPQDSEGFFFRWIRAPGISGISSQCADPYKTAGHGAEKSDLWRRPLRP